MRARRAVLVLWFAVLCCIPALAEADPLVLRIKGGVGFGGAFDSKLVSESSTGEASSSSPLVEDLLTSRGGGAFFEVPVHRYANVGAGLVVTSWTTEDADEIGLGSNTWYDFDLVARCHYPLLHERLWLYVSLPFGLSISRFSDEATAWSGANWGHGVGWNLSALLGAEYRFGSGGSVFLETGWTHHSFTHDGSGTVFGTSADISLEGSTDQLSLNLGVGFELTRDVAQGAAPR